MSKLSIFENIVISGSIGHLLAFCLNCMIKKDLKGIFPFIRLDVFICSDPLIHIMKGRGTCHFSVSICDVLGTSGRHLCNIGGINEQIIICLRIA
jgi:hypothetical protein